MPASVVVGTPQAAAQNEKLARTDTGDGTRTYQLGPNAASAPLCDSHGRLIVRQANGFGFETPEPTGGPSGVYGQAQESGSAPQKGGVGLVISSRALQRATFFDVAAINGAAHCTRMFGYAATAGFVQLILKDESAGANPPVITDVPEVSIPINAGQNFAFGDYYLGDGNNNATYIALSTTGPTFTPVGVAALWFYFFGYV